MTIGIFKEWLIKYFFVHKIVPRTYNILYVLGVIKQIYHIGRGISEKYPSQT
jgi:hypothetical protein